MNMQYRILKDLTDVILRVKKGKAYYFDKEGIYRSTSAQSVESLKNSWVIDKNGKRRLDAIVIVMENFDYENGSLLIKAICSLKEGDTIEKFKQILETVEYEERPKPTGIDRFVTKIEKPVFERLPENPKTNTFDYIVVDVNIVTDWEEDRRTYIQKHKKQICEMVLRKVQEDRTFKKFGVPVNFLKITSITLRKNSVLEFVLELKELKD